MDVAESRLRLGRRPAGSKGPREARPPQERKVRQGAGKGAQAGVSGWRAARGQAEGEHSALDQAGGWTRWRVAFGCLGIRREKETGGRPGVMRIHHREAT